MVIRHATLALVVVLAGVLTGCGTMQYVPKGESGGYSHTQLAPNVFDVHYSGHGRYDPERVWDFLLLRSAELCAEEGYAYFEMNIPGQPIQINTHSSGWIWPDMPPPTSVVRTHCYAAPSEEVDKRLDSRFIQRTLRDKYDLVG